MKNEIILPNEIMPDFLKNKQSIRGTENITAEDLIIPRLELVQDLSPCRKKQDPNYIDGIEEGMLYNNVTRQNYGLEALVLPVYYKKEFLLWKTRDSGGGFRGAFESKTEAEKFKSSLEDHQHIEIADTAQHFCLLIHPTSNKVEEVVVSMSRSKLKVSRKWNSLIRMNSGDSFSRVYKISTVSEKNAKNQDYYNFCISPAGYPTAEVYDRAEKLYEAISSGLGKVDRKFDEEPEISGSEY